VLKNLNQAENIRPANALRLFQKPKLLENQCSGKKKGRIMKPPIQPEQRTPVFLAALVLVTFALSPQIQAVSPPPDGGYPNGNTADGDAALKRVEKLEGSIASLAATVKEQTAQIQKVGAQLELKYWEIIADNPSQAGWLIEIPADSHKGFEFPYVLFIPPKGIVPQYLLIEPNNTGDVDDSLEVHRAAAIQTAKDSGVGLYVAADLGIPLLVPVIPRPKSIWNVYTHSLDRDTILIRDGPLHRIDLQLIAMADDAKHRLAELGRPVNDKLLMTGFSASGLFANRFTFLHPEVVAAAAYGGVNGFIMVPLEEMRSERLEFPLGLADYKAITGHSFEKLVYRRIPQFAYMGEKDEEDAVQADDGYPEPERSVVFKLFGRTMMPDRWKAVEAVYRKENLPAVEFKTYPYYGHEINEKTNGEVAQFFRRIISNLQRPNRSR
jgi:hypothetical protein